MAIEMNGKALADKICKELRDRCDMLRLDGIQPKLTIVTSGNDNASQVYVRNKIKRCEEIGIEVDIRHFASLDSLDIAMLCSTVYNPMIIQEPIAGKANHDSVANYIVPEYDVDGFSYLNAGMLANGSQPHYYPCTPKGIIRLLTEYDVPLEGKSVCVIGRSNIVGRPIARMMEQVGATLTLCHSKTPENVLYEAIKNADVVVSAVGKRNIVSYNRANIVTCWKMDWSNKVIVDVGMNRDKNGKLCGDIGMDIKDCCKMYTPVPRGVGPMTVAMLMENVIEYYERNA